MAATPAASTQEPRDPDEALKKRLIVRIAVAGVIVVALLGGLAVVDALYGPPHNKEVAEKSLEQEAAATKPEEKAEQKPAEPAAEVAQAEKKEETKPAPAAEPERTTSVVTPPPKPPRPLTLPATARPAIVKPGEPVAAPQRPEPQQEIARTAPPPSPLAQHAPASRPLSQAAERSTRQYVVQMGVFNNVTNAEELRAKLELAGIPAQIEARVQVGPFASRQEVDAAREKLRALGLEAGILMATKR